MKKQNFYFLMPVLALAVLFGSCTNLEENPVSQISPDNFFRTEDELVAAVVPVYNSLRGYLWSDGTPMMQVVASDEIVVPTRGGDWDDGGEWRRLHEHEWLAEERRVNDSWENLFAGVARANDVLGALAASPLSESSLVRTFQAEVQVLRAFYYWQLIDLFGNVPLVTEPLALGELPEQSTRAAVYDFIVQEITAALPNLDDSVPYERVTPGAANALLATVYLNAEVYSGTARWTECVQACDAIINSGQYMLQPAFTDVFSLDNQGNAEYIWAIGNRAESDAGYFRHQATLHYVQIPNTPWNGFSVVTDFYNRYDPDDARRDVLLVGPQNILTGPNAGQPAFERNGTTRLDFTVDFPLIGATESDGVRILKWPLDPAQTAQWAGNDWAIFRYAYILLTKAEAQFRLGNVGDALALVNQVRERNFDPAKPLGAVDLDAILDERGFELLWENFRRTDQIRHDRFLDAWSLKAASDGPHRNLYPIPQAQIDANPNLVQNPGY